MKKFMVVGFTAFLSLLLIACSSKPKLYILNWGEYINYDLVSEFEDTYGVTVKWSYADSNELMEQRVVSQTTAYDIVIPSDYMIEKLYTNGYLQKIDLTKLTNYSQDAFMDGVNVIMAEMFKDNEDVTSAYEVSIPYFWGVFGIMYNRSLDGLETYIETKKWQVMFEEDPADTFSRPLLVGMYDVPRFAYSLSMIYANEVELIDDLDALNVASAANLTLSETILSQRQYEEWSTDFLKKNIEAGLLDYAFVYVGDFFDTYLIKSAEATTAQEARDLTSHIGIFVPENTIAFYDGMVIPTNARNVDLAYQFIDFFLDPINAYENSSIVGYTTALTATYEMIQNATYGDEIRAAMVSDYPYNPAISENFAGKPLIAFSNEFTDEIASMVYRVLAAGN
ncbi:MAG: extracellular solute-binding protein [Firmicutes bacterium]|nr:extracellular solute-binding protein [Bacillota bacterium]